MTPNCLSGQRKSSQFCRGFSFCCCFTLSMAESFDGGWSILCGYASKSVGLGMGDCNQIF